MHGVATRIHQKAAKNTKARIRLGSWTIKVVKEKQMNEHIGSDFDAFLAEEAMLEEVTALAVKRVIAWQIEHEMTTQKITKTAMAKRMRTSRAALNRLLDENDTSLTLTTLASAASVLGKKLKIELAA